MRVCVCEFDAADYFSDIKSLQQQHHHHHHNRWFCSSSCHLGNQCHINYRHLMSRFSSTSQPRNHLRYQRWQYVVLTSCLSSLRHSQESTVSYVLHVYAPAEGLVFCFFVLFFYNLILVCIFGGKNFPHFPSIVKKSQHWQCCSSNLKKYLRNYFLGIFTSEFFSLPSETDKHGVCNTQKEAKGAQCNLINVILVSFHHFISFFFLSFSLLKCHLVKKPLLQFVFWLNCCVLLGFLLLLLTRSLCVFFFFFCMCSLSLRWKVRGQLNGKREQEVT